MKVKYSENCVDLNVTVSQLYKLFRLEGFVNLLNTRELVTVYFKSASTINLRDQKHIGKSNLITNAILSSCFL